MLGLNKDKVVLLPHDPEWDEEFIKEKARLEKIMGEYALDIQHIGSTSIPSIYAKPILDVAVAVENKDKLYELIPIMTAAGYDVKNSIDEGEILARKGPPECRTHYIHIEIYGDEYWNNHILFRDYLLSHPESAAEYNKLKMDMRDLYKEERKKYTANKHEFVQTILEKAKAEKEAILQD